MHYVEINDVDNEILIGEHHRSFVLGDTYVEVVCVCVCEHV